MYHREPRKAIALLRHPHGAIRQNTNLKEVSLVSDILNLVPRRSLLTHCPCEVWERVGESLSVTSRLTVECSLTEPSTRRDKAEISLVSKRFLYVASRISLNISAYYFFAQSIFIYLHKNVLLIHL